MMVDVEGLSPKLVLNAVFPRILFSIYRADSKVTQALKSFVRIKFGQEGSERFVNVGNFDLYRLLMEIALKIAGSAF